MQFSPQDFGYQRSRWCTELLAIKINMLMGLNVAASTLRRWLPRMGIVWRRPVPTLRTKDPAYQEKIAKIEEALTKCDAANPVFYENEVDINLNPTLSVRISVIPISHFGQIDHSLTAFLASPLFLPLLIGLCQLSHRLALQFHSVAVMEQPILLGDNYTVRRV